MDYIITEARSLSASVRSHAFPALESGNTSFPEGQYIVGLEPGSDAQSFTVQHRIRNANLISELIETGGVHFVCTVASPVSSYRVSHVSESSKHTIGWDSANLGEPPMFTPMVVVAKPFTRTLDSERDSVHELWSGRTVKFEQGMRLALSDVVLIRSSVMNMLLFERNTALSEGEFRVEAEAQEGFRFRVHLSADLHKFLKHNSQNQNRSHILTHIVSSCFALLKADHTRDEDEDGGWQSYRGLQVIARMLQSQGLPHWSEDDFSPELAATKLYPHRVDIFSNSPEED